MIPAIRRYEARYRHESPTPDGKPQIHFTEKSVIAWDEDGFPLVSNGKRLVRADTWSNFHGVLEEDPTVVAVAPGGGWMAEYKDDDGSISADPVVGWAVRRDGSAFPLDACSDGECSDPSEVSNFVRVYHPDRILPGWPTAPASDDDGTAATS